LAPGNPLISTQHLKYFPFFPPINILSSFIRFLSSFKFDRILWDYKPFFKKDYAVSAIVVPAID
jgi:hypothetical protein